MSYVICIFVFMTKEQEIDFKKILENGNKLAEMFPDILESISIPKFSISDIGLNSRVINNWEKKGLFLKDHDPRKRRKFDLIDAVWMKMIQKMRRFEISLNTIGKVKESLESEVTVDESNRETVEKTVIAMFGDDKKELASVFMKTEEYKRMLGNMKVNILQMIVLDIIALKNRYSLLINQDGESIPFKHTLLETFINEFNEKPFFNETFLSISINEMLVELIGELDTDDSMRLCLLTKEEAVVVQCIKEEGVKSIEIQLSKGEYKQPVRLVLTKEEIIKDNKRVNEILLNQGYEDIIMKTEKGKIVHFERKEKRKLN
jgi:DNA-binding transcriptional MerR regulator